MIEFRAIAAIVLGLALVTTGTSILIGRNRRWLRVYRNGALPVIVRTSPFLVLPTGVVVVCAGVVGLIPRDPSLLTIRLAGAVIVTIMFALLTIGFAFPPRIMMPRWFLESPEHLPARDKFDMVVATVAVIAAAVIVGTLLILLATSR